MVFVEPNAIADLDLTDMTRCTTADGAVVPHRLTDQRKNGPNTRPHLAESVANRRRAEGVDRTAWDTCGMDLPCQRCGRPVRSNSNNYDVFERMHYVCFHYEFEHGEVDVDDECHAGGCPSASVAGGRLEVIETARELADEAASGTPWHNAETPEFLEAFAGWLADSDGFYLNAGRVPPGNGWVVVRHALRAATIYE